MATVRGRSNDQYQFVLTPAELKDSANPYIQETLVAREFRTTRDAGDSVINPGEVPSDLERGVTFNHKVVNEVTVEFLQGNFPEHWEKLLFHWSQVPGVITAQGWQHIFSRATTYQHAKFDGEKTAHLLNADVAAVSDLKDSDQDLYLEGGEVYLKITALIPLNKIPGLEELYHHDDAKKVEKRSIQSLFKLTNQGYELISISTNQPIFRDCIMGTLSPEVSDSLLNLGSGARQHAASSSVDTGHNIPSPQVVGLKQSTYKEPETRAQGWIRFKQKWSALSTVRKVLAGFFIGLGIAAIVAGAFFVSPSLAVTLPAVGKMTVSSLLIVSGSLLATGTGAGHVLDVITSNQPVSDVRFPSEAYSATDTYLRGALQYNPPVQTRKAYRSAVGAVSGSTYSRTSPVTASVISERGHSRRASTSALSALPVDPPPLSATNSAAEAAATHTVASSAVVGSSTGAGLKPHRN